MGLNTHSLPASKWIMQGFNSQNWHSIRVQMHYEGRFGFERTKQSFHWPTLTHACALLAISELKGSHRRETRRPWAWAWPSMRCYLASLVLENAAWTVNLNKVWEGKQTAWERSAVSHPFLCRLTGVRKASEIEWRASTSKGQKIVFSYHSLRLYLLDGI